MRAFVYHRLADLKGPRRGYPRSFVTMCCRSLSSQGGSSQKAAFGSVFTRMMRGFHTHGFMSTFGSSTVTSYLMVLPVRVTFSTTCISSLWKSPGQPSHV